MFLKLNNLPLPNRLIGLPVTAGGTFSKGKYMTIGGRYCGTITTFFSKDNLVAEVFETA